MHGTTYGFSLHRRRRSGSGSGGGTGEQTRWAADAFTQTAAWGAGAISLALSQAPVDTDGLQVWSQGMILHPTDYTVLTSPNRVRIEFAADPATDTDTGEWRFVVRYPYLL